MKPKIALHASGLMLISLLSCSLALHSWSFNDLKNTASQSWQKAKQAASSSYQKAQQALAPSVAKTKQAAAQAQQKLQPVTTKVQQAGRQVQQAMQPAVARAQALSQQAQQQLQPAINKAQQAGQQLQQAATQAAGTLSQDVKKLVTAGEQELKKLKASGEQTWEKFKTEAEVKLDLIKNPERVALRARYNTENARKQTPSTVYVGPALPAEEQQIIQQRQALTYQNSAKFLAGKLPANVTLTQQNQPRIGIVASGGGYRAMIATLGFLMGLEQIGVLNSALYLSALSGSTWLLAPWTSLNLSLADTNNYLRQYSANSQQLLDPITDQAQLQKVANNIIRKYAFNNPLSSIDLYGALIANKIFGSLPQRQNLYLTDQAANLQNGQRLFPIYTAIEPVAKERYRWYEFTPYRFGSADLNHYIDIWGMGRLFQKGQAQALPTLEGDQYGPDLPLGFLLGICGSAYTVSVDELIKIMSQAPLNGSQRIALAALKAHAQAENSGGFRIYPAFVPNFTAGLASSPIAQASEIKLVDAGLDTNLPFMPLIDGRRQFDILIALDASNPIESGKALQIAAQRAQERGYKFPKLDPAAVAKLDSSSFTVFSDPDPATPTVIYVPLVRDNSLPGLATHPTLSNFDPQVCANSSFCSTFNFKYSAAQFEQLRAAAEFNVTANQDQFWQAIAAAVAKKTTTAPVAVPAATPAPAPVPAALAPGTAAGTAAAS